LDVGSGGGEFAYLLKSLGHEVRGAEPNRGYANYSAEQYGLTIARGFISDMPLPDQGFDLITMWHVLEHTEDPGAVLRQLRNALRPGGKLVVEVPNVTATCHSPRSSFHEAHVYTFGIPTLNRLAGKSGFRPLNEVLSGDGGNLTATYAADPEFHGAEATDWRLPGNHQQVTAVIAAHTPLSHALSWQPWRRAAGRFARVLEERWALRSAGTGKALLNFLYAREVQPHPAPSRGLWWAWLMAAYTFAVVMEELLLDRMVPLDSLSDSQTLGVYVAVQCAVVGGLLAALKHRPGSVRDLAGVGGWAAPLFAIPALC
jgi:SAM-dependent methyltransferase